MKKTLALVIVATMILSMFTVFGVVSADGNPNEYVAHRFTVLPTIDGVISEGEWDGAATYVIKANTLDFLQRYWGGGNGTNEPVVQGYAENLPYEMTNDSTIYISWASGYLYIAGFIADTTVGGNAYNGGMAGTHYWGSGGPVGDFVYIPLRNDGTNFHVATNGTNKKDHDPGDYSTGGSGMEDTLGLVICPFPKGNTNRDGAVAPAVLEMWNCGQVINQNDTFGKAAAVGLSNGYSFEYYVNMGLFSAWGVKNYVNWYPDYKFNDSFTLADNAELYFTPVICDAGANWSAYVDWLCTDGPYTNFYSGRYGALGSVNCENIMNALAPESKYVKFAAPLDIATIDAANLTIGSDLTVTFLASLKGTAAYANPQMKVTRNGEETLVTGTLVSGSTYSFAYTGIKAQNMSDTIKAELIGSDGTTVRDTVNYSVQQYCDNMMGASADLDQLITDMLAYGYLAQQYTGFKAELTPSDEDDFWNDTTLFSEGYAAPTNIVKSSDNTAVIKAARAVVSNTNYIEFRVLGAEGKTAVINGVATEITSDDMYVRSAGITPKQLETTFTCEVVDGETTIATAQYNLAAYIANMGGEDGTDDGFELLLQALWCYGQTAAAYNG